MSSSIYQEEGINSTRLIPAPSAQRRSASDREPDRFLEITMLRKMYFVSAETFSGDPKK